MPAFFAEWRLTSYLIDLTSSSRRVKMAGLIVALGTASRPTLSVRRFPRKA